MMFLHVALHFDIPVFCKYASKKQYFLCDIMNSTNHNMTHALFVVFTNTSYKFLFLFLSISSTSFFICITLLFLVQLKFLAFDFRRETIIMLTG